VNPNLATRRTHYWASALFALPLIVIIGSGLLLQVKKQWSWVQPPEQRQATTDHPVSLDSLLRSATGAAGVTIRGWNSIDRVDVRPAKGIAKLTTADGWEVQLELATGRVLQTAYRRSDLIESLHDGSYFAGDWTKLGLFLPTGVVLAAMWGTGLWMFWLPFSVRRRRRSAAESNR
jgi:hypothetical protein